MATMTGETHQLQTYCFTVVPFGTPISLSMLNTTINLQLWSSNSNFFQKVTAKEKTVDPSTSVNAYTGT